MYDFVLLMEKLKGEGVVRKRGGDLVERGGEKDGEKVVGEMRGVALGVG